MSKAQEAHNDFIRCMEAGNLNDLTIDTHRAVSGTLTLMAALEAVPEATETILEKLREVETLGFFDLPPLPGNVSAEEYRKQCREAFAALSKLTDNGEKE